MPTPAIPDSPVSSHCETCDAALESLRLDVATRLQRVCAEMPPEVFALLVERIARRKLRWQMREAARERLHAPVSRSPTLVGARRRTELQESSY